MSNTSSKFEIAGCPAGQVVCCPQGVGTNVVHRLITLNSLHGIYDRSFQKSPQNRSSIVRTTRTQDFTKCKLKRLITKGRWTILDIMD